MRHRALVLVGVWLVCAPGTASVEGQAQQKFDPVNTKLVVRPTGTDGVTVAENVVFKSVDGSDLAIDIYARAAQGPQPAVVLVSGGTTVRTWGLYKDYGRLVAASGMIAVVPDKRYQQGPQGIEQGSQDTLDLLAHLRENAAKYGIDAGRICMWTFSAGGNLVHLGLQPEQGLACVVAYYGLGVAAARNALRQHAEKMPPMLVVRAGRDSPVLNNAIDVFIGAALSLNAPVTLINYPDGLHAFEVEDFRPEVTQASNVAATGRILRSTLDWIRSHAGVQSR